MGNSLWGRRCLCFVVEWSHVFTYSFFRRVGPRVHAIVVSFPSQNNEKSAK